MSNDKMREALERIAKIPLMPPHYEATFEARLIAREALAAAPKPKNVDPVNTPPERVEETAKREHECRHCGFLCRPNPAESRKWYPLEQAEPSGNPGEFAAHAGEQVGLTRGELWSAIDSHVERLQLHTYEHGLPLSPPPQSPSSRKRRN